MRFILSSIFAFLFSFGSFAQILTPVTWSAKAKKISDSEYDIVFSASIESGWHLYSQNIPEGGPSATIFSFEGAGTNYELVGETVEPKGHDVFDEMFQMDIKYFESDTEFTQKIKVLNSGEFKLKASVNFMACDDSNCLPPEDIDFDLVINKGAAKVATSDDAKVDEDSAAIGDDIDASSASGLWKIFLLAFGGGILALLTPCVFPMIPMTVSFFTKQSKTKAAGIKNAVLYGVSIIVIYEILGIGVSYIFGADALNALSTNVWFNLFFFLMLIVFAASFFGAFEIVLPNSWLNAADKNSDKGGLIGIFFMAFTLALVSFSCTGPIVGTLLVGAAQSGEFLAPIIGMFGFSLALALPFALFAAFPGWLNTLPKSGGWLNSVKVVLGFIELAMAFKFLSVADMVLQLHLLERELFIAIWVVIFGALGFYLLGKLRLPHDSPMEYISVSRLFMGLTVLAFTVYLIPGIWGAPTKLISGFPPPKNYAESPYGVGFSGGGSAPVSVSSHGDDDLLKHAHIGPQNILAFDDYDYALEYAKQVNKPLLLDFTGWGCVNCRKMEDNVWSVEKVKSVLSSEFVLVSLYVDEKQELPESEKYTSTVTGKKIKTIGNKWSDFQIAKYNKNAQPFYVIEDHEGNAVNTPRAYNTDVDKYLEWMKDGIEKFHNK